MMNTRSAVLAITAFSASLCWTQCAFAQSAAALPPPVNGPAANAAGAQAKSPAVSPSSSTVSEPTVADLYPIEKMHLRDPFVKSGAAGAGGEGEIEMTDINIHNLVLKGILYDRTGDFALFVDPASGSNLYLKKGLLFNARNEAVPGITGVIKAKQKTVHLITPEKDVQTFILGEQGGADK